MSPSLKARIPRRGGKARRPWSVSGQMQVGMNAGPINAYNARRFANICYDMNPWQPAILSGGGVRTPGAWSQNQGTLIGDGDGSGTDGKYFRATIASTAYGLPAGVYTVFNPSGQELALGAFSSLYLQTFTTAKYFQFTYAPSNSGMFMWCRRSLQNTGAGNVQIILPGCVGDGTVDTVNGTYQLNGTHGITAGNPWNPDFLTFDSGLGLHHQRWMPMQRVIGSTEIDFSDRVLPTGISFTNFAGSNAVPLELICDYSNRMGIDPWINMPSQSTPAYWAAAAAVCRTYLDPNRRTAVEYIDEGWNYAAAYIGDSQWVAWLQYTKHYAAVADVSVPGLPVFYQPSHGRSVGDSLVLFATRENAPLGNNAIYFMQQGYAYTISAVSDADHFTLNLAGASHVIPTGLVNIQYAWAAEPGKSSTGAVPDQNFATKQLAIWDAFDAALGVGRVVHVCASQAGNAAVTTNRMSTGAMATRAKHVAVAPYYSGLYWRATFTGGGSKITPSVWVSVAGTVYYGFYAAGSTPSDLDVVVGTGAGLISASSQSAAAFALTTGAALTGLTDGTSYAAFAVFKEAATGMVWKIGTGTDPLNPTSVFSTTTAGAQHCFDTFANQAARCRLNQVSTSNEVAHKAAIAAAGSSATLISYEGGGDFNGGEPTELLSWLLVNYFPSTEHASTITHSLNHLARVGYQSYTHYIDIQGGGVIAAVGNEYPYDLVPNQLFSATAVDGRYAAMAAFGGLVTAQAPISGSVSTNRAAAAILSSPGSFPHTVLSGLPGGFTYSIVNGDWLKNFGISGVSVVMNNATGINFSRYSPETLTIEANDGFSSTSFKLSIPLGSAWYESDAQFVLDSVGVASTATLTPPSNPPFASYGAVLTEVAGTGTPAVTSSSGTVSNDLLKMAGFVFANANALPANLPLYDASSNPIPMLIMILVDIGDQATTAFAYGVGIGSGSTSISFGTPSSASVTAWKVFIGGATVAGQSDGTCPAKGTKAVHWCFIDSANGQVVTGINQTVGTTTNVAIPSGAPLSRDIRLGSYNGQTASNCQMYLGSIEVLSRPGLTLTQAKAAVQNAQTHHGI